MSNLNLDVGAPTQVAVVLRAAANKYRADASDLRSTWQDATAGRIWDAATVLDAAAVKADAALQRDPVWHDATAAKVKA